MNSESENPTGEDITAVLDSLGNEIPRRILVAGCRDVVTAVSVAESLDISKTTAYRHLNRLKESGLVTEVTDIRDSPSSRTGYRTNIRTLLVNISRDGIITRPDTEGELQLAIAVLLEYIDVEDMTVDFETGSMSVTLRADDDVLEQIREGYFTFRNGN